MDFEFKHASPFLAREEKEDSKDAVDAADVADTASEKDSGIPKQQSRQCQVPMELKV